MASGVWEFAKAEIARGNIDWANDTIKIVLVDADFSPVFDTAGGQFLDDISGGDIIGDAITLASASVTDAGVLDAADPTVTSVSASLTVAAYVVYYHTGTDSTSTLIMYGDCDNLNTDGNNVVVTFDGTNGVFKL